MSSPARLLRPAFASPSAIRQRTCIGLVPAKTWARSHTTSPVLRATVQDGPALTQTNRAEVTLRRFWKTVHIKQEESGDFAITLDHRALKTPGGAKLNVPKDRRLLALLIANEWENQDEVLKQHALPVMMKYLDTDTILFPNDEPRPLVRLQQEHWDPLLEWVQEKYSIKLNLADGFAPAKQSPETVSKLREVIEKMDNYELAAFERATYASKSFIIALALCQGRLTADEAANASHVEVRSQIELWGEDIRRSLGSVSCLLIKA
ncbi:hypothetical protein IAU60_005764 [Kwoniella sp. DSM 27419]